MDVTALEYAIGKDQASSHPAWRFVLPCCRHGNTSLKSFGKSNAVMFRRDTKYGCLPAPQFLSKSALICRSVSCSARPLSCWLFHTSMSIFVRTMKNGTPCARNSCIKATSVSVKRPAVTMMTMSRYRSPMRAMYVFNGNIGVPAPGKSHKRTLGSHGKAYIDTILVVSWTPTGAQPAAPACRPRSLLISKLLPTPEFPTTPTLIVPSNLASHVGLG
mmetsp:Transcript_100171/g.306193  ORF Transcript_100171/g.306193 Transcript_100171/m.306193 type:complete len:217 (+) Transcript_100171:419-1069(+)